MYKFTKLFLFSLIFFNQKILSETKYSIARKQTDSAEIESGLLKFAGMGVGALSGALISSMILEKFAPIDENADAHVVLSIVSSVLGCFGGCFIDKLFKDNDLVRARRIFITNNFSKFQNLEPKEVIEWFNKFFSNNRFPLISSFYDFQAYKNNLIGSKNLFLKVLNKSKNEKIVSECKSKILKIDLMLSSINKVLSYLFENAEYKSQVEMQNLEQNQQNAQLLRDIQLNQIIFSCRGRHGF